MARVPHLALLVAIASAASGCAATAPAVPRARAAQAVPEPDPACRATVQDRMAARGVDEVVAKVSIDASGRPARVELLTPDLTPAVAADLRDAFRGCLWAPADAPGGTGAPRRATFLYEVKRGPPQK